MNGVPIFIAHRGVKCILEAFNEYGGGSIQPLMQYIMKEMHGESDTQQVRTLVSNHFSYANLI